MAKTAAELKQIAMEQEAWGKWNTAPAWNRYYEAKRREHPIAHAVQDAAVCLFGLASTGLLVHSLLKLVGVL